MKTACASCGGPAGVFIDACQKCFDEYSKRENPLLDFWDWVYEQRELRAKRYCLCGEEIPKDDSYACEDCLSEMLA